MSSCVDEVRSERRWTFIVLSCTLSALFQCWSRGAAVLVFSGGGFFTKELQKKARMGLELICSPCALAGPYQLSGSSSIYMYLHLDGRIHFPKLALTGNLPGSLASQTTTSFNLLLIAFVVLVCSGISTLSPSSATPMSSPTCSSSSRKSRGKAASSSHFSRDCVRRMLRTVF